MADAYSPIDHLAVLIARTWELAQERGMPSGRQEGLSNLRHRVKRIRSFRGTNIKKRIGVFGAPKRGKSTLLNTLLGEELLPTSPVPLSTTTIEIEHAPALIGYELIIDGSSGRVEKRHCESISEAARLLEAFGSRRAKLETAERLRVQGNFPRCEVFAHGGLLMDTPGVEVAFEPDKALAEEANRALKALEDTHLVLFCLRADQLGNRSDSKFYEDKIRNLAPLHVVTMKDKWTDTVEDLENEVLSHYGLAPSQPLLVSSTTHRADAGQSGIPQLLKQIVTELNQLYPENGVLPCLQLYQLAIDRCPEVMPERIHFMNVEHALRSIDTDWAHAAITHLCREDTKWKR